MNTDTFCLVLAMPVIVNSEQADKGSPGTKTTMGIPAWKLIILVLVTVGLLFVSRRALCKPRSHGFYRFFAWEIIVLLFLVNMDYWFIFPFSWYQVCSWLLLSLSLVPLIWGIRLLRKYGKASPVRAGDQALLSFEKTSSLVTIGIFKYIRHPLYSSLLFLTWGIFCKHIFCLGAGFALLASFFLLLTALAEEKEMEKAFGYEYEQYRKHTKRFIPYIF